jgi:phenylacetate-CoA ligase
MNIALLLKNNLKNIPPFLGIPINKIPYSKRPGIGKIYTQRKNEILLFDSFSKEQKQNYIFERMKSIVNFSYNNIPFYKEYYAQKRFHPEALMVYQDIQKIPIVNKTVLREYNIDIRSFAVPNRYIVNTGGSSGIPFGFYIEPTSMGHEWAHMHSIWERLGYKASDLKLGFGGRSDVKNIVEYDVLRNSYSIDLYKNYKLISRKLKNILRTSEIKYLHGYPSSIYNFALYCKHEDNELQDLLSKHLRGAFLGSEYPHALYRNVIENVFNINSVSWYGHTERCILAYEKNEKYVYEPFQTYGLAETITMNNELHLIGTSYYNHASPLIRYDTNDIISDIELSGDILQRFKITKGREGEFVIDKQGNKINLTALIFGRHHKLFNFARFVQVKQIMPGKIELLFVSNTISEEEAENLFDKKNVDLDITFIRRNEPVMTLSGKINLLVKDTMDTQLNTIIYPSFDIK